MVQDKAEVGGSCSVRKPLPVRCVYCDRLYTASTELGSFATPFRVMYFKWQIIKPRPKLRLRQTGRIAQDLHARMYTAFAE